MIDLTQIPSPCYVMEEQLLRRNLARIRSVEDRAGVTIILAFKAFALWKSFPIIREYIGHSTASSVAEARLAFEEMGSPAHSYAPAYIDEEFPAFAIRTTLSTGESFRQGYPLRVAHQPRLLGGRDRSV